MAAPVTRTATPVFLDTNVFVYADDDDLPTKRDRARQVITDTAAAGTAVVSTQVMSEYASVATRKLGLSPADCRLALLAMARLAVVPVGPEHVHRALDLAALHRLSLWDGLVVATAAAAGCGVLLTEDLQTGRVLDGVRVENPFAGLGEAGDG
jgi:predicted nucleic acid-binding protein